MDCDDDERTTAAACSRYYMNYADSCLAIECLKLCSPSRHDASTTLGRLNRLYLSMVPCTWMLMILIIAFVERPVPLSRLEPAKQTDKSWLPSTQFRLHRINLYARFSDRLRLATQRPSLLLPCWADGASCSSSLLSHQPPFLPPAPTWEHILSTASFVCCCRFCCQELAERIWPLLLFWPPFTPRNGSEPSYSQHRQTRSTV